MAKTCTSIETLAVQADHFTDPQTGAIVPSVAASNTFARNQDYELPAGLRYSRYGNPTVILGERLLAKLDDASLKTVALRRLEGHSSEEIAAQLGVSKRTVDRKLHLIRMIWTEEAGE